MGFLKQYETAILIGAFCAALQRWLPVLEIENTTGGQLFWSVSLSILGVYTLVRIIQEQKITEKWKKYSLFGILLIAIWMVQVNKMLEKRFNPEKITILVERKVANMNTDAIEIYNCSTIDIEVQNDNAPFDAKLELRVDNANIERNGVINGTYRIEGRIRLQSILMVVDNCKVPGLSTGTVILDIKDGERIERYFRVNCL